jgi:hypothetical protein
LGKVFSAVCFGGTIFYRGIAPSKLDHFEFWARPQRINNQARGRILGLSIFGEMWTSWNAWAWWK